MSTFEVTVETVTIFPHPNADLLELAQIGLYRAVVAKGQYQTGDQVIYIPEFAVLPETLIDALGLAGKLGGSQKNRVLPVRLRGELSQGVIAPLSVLPAGFDYAGVRDLAPVLGITKWQPEVPAHFAGDVSAAGDLLGWIDIENLKKFPDMFASGERVVVTEKVHGTCQLVTVTGVGTPQEQVFVSSKGLGEKKLALKEAENVVYWRSYHQYGLHRVAEVVAEVVPGVISVGLYGETFGSRIQDLHYGFTGGALGYVLFDVSVVQNVDGTQVARWLNFGEFQEVVELSGVPTVPVLFEGEFSLDVVREFASGREQVSGRELHIREGVVVRPVDRGGDWFAGKRVGKFVSDAYLTRKGGTEYQ